MEEEIRKPALYMKRSQRVEFEGTNFVKEAINPTGKGGPKKGGRGGGKTQGAALSPEEKTKRRPLERKKPASAGEH